MKKQVAMLAAVLLSACSQERIVANPPPPPPSYLTCEALPAVPEIDALTAYRTGDIEVYLKSEVDVRDGKIARWIVSVRESWFSCWNATQKVKDYYDNQVP